MASDLEATDAFLNRLPAGQDHFTRPAKISFFNTGASGFLDSCVISDLLRCPIERVRLNEAHVQADLELEARERRRHALLKLIDIDVGQLNRVDVVHGDLAEERLGLSDAAWQSLGTQKNILIHCGADVSLLPQAITLHTKG